MIIIISKRIISLHKPVHFVSRIMYLNRLLAAYATSVKIYSITDYFRRFSLLGYRRSKLLVEFGQSLLLSLELIACRRKL